ncbi:MAG: hypothetical protein AABZ40_03595, partial [Thermodesulfobacteriota bacterium]
YSSPSSLLIASRTGVSLSHDHFLAGLQFPFDDALSQFVIDRHIFRFGNDDHIFCTISLHQSVGGSSITYRILTVKIFSFSCSTRKYIYLISFIFYTKDRTSPTPYPSSQSIKNLFTSKNSTAKFRT